MAAPLSCGAGRGGGRGGRAETNMVVFRIGARRGLDAGEVLQLLMYGPKKLSGPGFESAPGINSCSADSTRARCCCGAAMARLAPS